MLMFCKAVLKFLKSVFEITLGHDEISSNEEGRVFLKTLNEKSTITQYDIQCQSTMLIYKIWYIKFLYFFYQYHQIVTLQIWQPNDEIFFYKLFSFRNRSNHKIKKYCLILKSLAVYLSKNINSNYSLVCFMYKLQYNC